MSESYQDANEMYLLIVFPFFSLDFNNSIWINADSSIERSDEKRH